MISRFFIDRPVLANVLAIVMVVIGAAALLELPIAQYPKVVPPTISVMTRYPGASAATVMETVALPIEQQVNGVERMLYMQSTSANDGTYALTVTFEIGTDLNAAQILVQNRVSSALASLPQPVQAQGVTVQQKSTAILMIATLTSPDNRYDSLYLSNYATISTSEQQYQAARDTSAALTEALVTELRTYGLPVERTDRLEAPGPGRFILVDGHLLAVHQGNRTKRTMIGLGRGKGSIEAAAQLYYLDRGTPPRLLESFDASADSGYAPGMAETMGVGAAAGRVATSAAAGGGVHAAIEGSRAEDTAEARRLGDAQAQWLGQFFAQQGWIAVRR